MPTTPAPAPTDLTRLMADQMVVSVGPYRFHNSPPAARSRSANSPPSASPPHNFLNPVAPPLHPDSNSSLQVAGVACISVALLEESEAANSLPSTAVSRLAMTRRAPL